ncbi:MAG: DUF692 family protein [Clostridia bacterium]|nr:DUF692 family protein [Clostridia bacterium]
MELCVNYTSEVKELFEEEKIDFIDYFKLYSINGDLSPFDWCAKNKKVIFHGLVGHGANAASKRFLNDRNWKLQKEYYEKSRCPHISFHINIDNEEELESEEDMIETIMKNISKVRKICDYDILLENVPANIGNKERNSLANPEFICKVIEKANVYFLLDIAHAKAAAEVLNIPYQKYIDALPLDKVREIHLSGCELNNEGLIRANHSEMKKEDYEMLNYLLEKCSDVRVLTLEYGPYDVNTERILPSYDKVDDKMKQNVYDNLLRLKDVIDRV